MTTGAIDQPDAVVVWADGDEALVASPRGDDWQAPGVDVLLDSAAAGLEVRIAARRSVARVALRWNRPLAENALVLGDAWERSYGDLQWQPPQPYRVLPWYWVAETPGAGTHGAGVRVRAGSLAHWTADTTGVTLWLDVRSGSRTVLLGERVLHAATVVRLDADPGRSAFESLRELTAALCSDPLLPATPLVGSNNWYYAYGTGFDADAVLGDARLVVGLADGHPVRPYAVIDAGWSEGGVAPGGPWTEGTDSFTDMADIARRIQAEGARPGLWFRPLLSRTQTGLTRPDGLDGSWPLDPSLPETLAQVTADITRFREWGYELVKHDFSTYDVTGRFMGRPEAGLEPLPWKFADSSRTTAEILVDFYSTIRDAAGDMTLIGCNTVGHLAAGLQHAQRSGDDTSGRHWERTRKMGVNTLAFRLAQHNAFFAVDPDCVPSTPETPWPKNRQFLELVAASGTALFVSVDPATFTTEVEADLKAAVKVALDGGARGGVEPLDWQAGTTPSRWRLGHSERTYDWSAPWGVDVAHADT